MSLMTQLCTLRRHSALCAFHSTDVNVTPAQADFSIDIMVHGSWLLEKCGKTPLEVSAAGAAKLHTSCTCLGWK